MKVRKIDYEYVLANKYVGSKNKFGIKEGDKLPHTTCLGKFKYEGTDCIAFKCECGDVFFLTVKYLANKYKSLNTSDIHCECLSNKKSDEELLEIYRNKNYSKTEEKSHYCSYCGSYTEKPKNNAGRYCDNCYEINKRGLVVGETFESIMDRWDKRTHKLNVSKLPLLKGNNKKGYTIVGFTYIDSEWYEEASSWLWIRSIYAKTAFSRQNMLRNNLEYKNIKDRSHKYMLLHRFVLGLGNDCPLVGDHINGHVLDNRLSNLRIATVTQNSHNSRKVKKKTASKYKGIRQGRNGEWFAQLQIKGKWYGSGRLETEVEAAKAYDKLLREYRKDSPFNRYNFPEEGERGIY